MTQGKTVKWWHGSAVSGDEKAVQALWLHGYNFFFSFVFCVIFCITFASVTHYVTIFYSTRVSMH